MPETRVFPGKENDMEGGSQPGDSTRVKLSPDRCRMELAPLNMEPVLRHNVTSF